MLSKSICDQCWQDVLGIDWSNSDDDLWGEKGKTLCCSLVIGRYSEQVIKVDGIPPPSCYRIFEQSIAYGVGHG